MNVNAIPDGYHTVTPYFVVARARKFIQFLEEAFDAIVVNRHEASDGRIMNAEVRLGSSMVMLGEPQQDCSNPRMTSMLYLYVPNADAVFLKALKAGAKTVSEMTDQFYGDRSGAVEDEWGNQWWIASRREVLTQEELDRRAAALRK